MEDQQTIVTDYVIPSSPLSNSRKRPLEQDEQQVSQTFDSKHTISGHQMELDGDVAENKRIKHSWEADDWDSQHDYINDSVLNAGIKFAPTSKEYKAKTKWTGVTWEKVSDPNRLFCLKYPIKSGVASLAKHCSYKAILETRYMTRQLKGELIFILEEKYWDLLPDDYKKLDINNKLKWLFEGNHLVCIVYTNPHLTVEYRNKKKNILLPQPNGSRHHIESVVEVFYFGTYDARGAKCLGQYGINYSFGLIP